VDWVECVVASAGADVDPFDAVRASLKMRIKTSYGSPGKVAVLPVASIKAIAVKGASLRVCEAPTISNPCHSRIEGFLGMDVEVARLTQLKLFELATFHAP
jgi:hypothetical protein